MNEDLANIPDADFEVPKDVLADVPEMDFEVPSEAQKDYIAEFNAINPDEEAQTQFAKINELANKGNADAKRFIQESSVTGYTRPQQGELDLGGYLGKFQEQQHSQMFDETAQKLSENLGVDIEEAKNALATDPRAMQLVAENGYPDSINGWANFGAMLGLDKLSAFGRVASAGINQIKNGSLDADRFKQDMARTQGFENQGFQNELMSPTLPASIAMGGTFSKLGGKAVSRMLPTTTTKAIGEGIGGALMGGFEQLGQAGTALAENSALGGDGLHRTQAPPTMKETALMMLTSGAFGGAMPYAKKGFDSFVKPMFKAKPQAQMTQAMPNQSTFAQTTQAIPAQTTPIAKGATQIPQQATSQNILNDIEFGADLTQNEIYSKLKSIAPQIPLDERRVLGQKIYERSSNMQGLSPDAVNAMRNPSIANALHTKADADNVERYIDKIDSKSPMTSTSVFDDFVTEYRPQAKQALKKEANEIGAKIGEFRTQLGLKQTTSKEDVLDSWNDSLDKGLGLRVELNDSGEPFLIQGEKGSKLRLGSAEENEVMAMTKDILKRTKSGEMTEDQLQTAISMLRDHVPYQKTNTAQTKIEKTISRFRDSLKDKAILNFENKMRDNGIDESEIAEKVKEYNDNLKAFAINRETDQNFDKILGKISTTLDDEGNEIEISAKSGTPLLRQIGRSGTETSRALSDIFKKHLNIDLPKEVSHMKIASDISGGSASAKSGVSGWSIFDVSGGVKRLLSPDEKTNALLNIVSKRQATERQATKGINLEGKK